MSIAITEEHHALAESIRAWARTACPVAAIRDMEPASADQPRGAEPAARAVPDGLAEIGLLSIGVPTAAGGAGGTVVDVAVGLEEAAAQLAHGPVFGCVLAAILLAQTPNATAAKELLPQLGDGAGPIAVGFATEPLPAQRSADGGLVVDGVAGPILDLDAGTHVLLPALVAGEVVWFVAAPDLSGRTVRAQEGLDFSRSIGHLQLTGAVIAPTAVLAGLSTSTVRNYAATLASAEAAGVANWCVRTASEYARVREQFGQPIGSFQAVKHLCAEMLVRAEVAAALTWDAARAADEDSEQHELACAVAACSALDAAVDNAKDCVQVLGAPASRGSTTRTCTCAGPYVRVNYSAARHAGVGRRPSWPWPAADAVSMSTCGPTTLVRRPKRPARTCVRASGRSPGFRRSRRAFVWLMRVTWLRTGRGRTGWPPHQRSS